MLSFFGYYPFGWQKYGDMNSSMAVEMKTSDFQQIFNLLDAFHSKNYNYLN